MSAKMISQTLCFSCEREGKICTFIKVYKFTNYKHFIISVEGPVFPVKNSKAFSTSTAVHQFRCIPVFSYVTNIFCFALCLGVLFFML